MKRSLKFCGQYLIHSNHFHHVVNRSQNANVQHALMMISSTAGGGTREATYCHHHPITTHLCLFSSVKKNISDLPPGPAKRGRRVWKSHQQQDVDHIINHTGDASQTKSNVCDDAGVEHVVSVSNDFWCTAVDEAHDCQESLSRICEQVSKGSLLPNRLCYGRLLLNSFSNTQERQGGRMKQSQLGVLRDDPHDDIRVLIENYTGETLGHPSSVLIFYGIMFRSP